MRQQLIKWLIEDIIPEAQHTRDAEGSILKFAEAHNLAPAQVEAIGQLFNTAKTLSHLEKAANRGASFPILDVPGMVGRYLDVPVKSHRAAGTGVDKQSADLSLPQCLAGWENLGEEREIKTASVAEIDAEDPSIFAKERAGRYRRRENNIGRANLELTKQARFDFQEESRRLMTELHTSLRSNRDIEFSDLETDAISLFGEPVVPVFSKLASFLAGHKWRVTRGKVDDTKRLIPEYAGAMDKIAKLIDLHFMAVAAEDLIKEAAAQGASSPFSQGGGGTMTEEEPASREPHQPKKKDDVGLPSAPSSANSKREDRKSYPSGKSTPVEKSFFGRVNSTMDAAAGKGYDLLEPVVRSALGGDNNNRQRTVDTAHMDAKHIATLQKLMMTDEVLAEADPEKVISTYNTLREVAPNLAGDANVMRVALRSAIQHDGISPFDIKSFLDTESARQKTDYNRRLEDALNYKGQEMGNRPA